MYVDNITTRKSVESFESSDEVVNNNNFIKIWIWIACSDGIHHCWLNIHVLCIYNYEMNKEYQHALLTSGN